jgi:hypothetical protein
METARRQTRTRLWAPTILLMLMAACAPEPTPPVDSKAPDRVVESNPLRNAYFGDLHVHTAWSFDAFFFTNTTPDDAYRFAKGEAIVHPAGFEMRLDSGPLDFLAVADHAEFLGVLPAMSDPGQAVSNHLLAATVAAAHTVEERAKAFGALLGLLGPDHNAQPPAELLDRNLMAATWSKLIEIAGRHNEPGRFTTFAAFEYTAGPSFQNLHRNVIYRSGDAPEVPFSRFDSQSPEDLWAWMDAHRAAGIEALAIPHNSNGSNGQMFKPATFDGEPFDAAYAEVRMRNEPVVEVTQIKGTSEVHPLLSPTDEWADFEIFPYRIATRLPSEPDGGYVRKAYLDGLVIEENRGLNPFRFGLIGSTDTHIAAGTVEEWNFKGKVGVHDATPQQRGTVPVSTSETGEPTYGDAYPYRLFSSSGLAGVWAESNTREAIFDALRRKEVFATSGPRITVRFFAGFGFADGLVDDPDLVATAYATGVPMGGDLEAHNDNSPTFVLWAMRDPRSAPLQRLQIVKGWVENGTARETVFDVACSDGLRPDPANHRCPDNDATVDLTDCGYSTDRGAVELRTLWQDPEFEPSQRAFFYVRVLENPTCRWSTWDAIRAGVEPREGIPVTIQERAWSSPIWFNPRRLQLLVRE